MNDFPDDIDILRLQKEGHSYHCAMQMLRGDGECCCGQADNRHEFMARMDSLLRRYNERTRRRPGDEV